MKDDEDLVKFMRWMIVGWVIGVLASLGIVIGMIWGAIKLIERFAG